MGRTTNGTGVSLGDLIAAAFARAEAIAPTPRAAAKLVGAFPRTIDKRGGTILKMRALSENPARLADVGRCLSISGERVRQLEDGVLTGLRNFIEARVAA
jgi:DNA-directed RNA polymerase sigma subunit (sigma70/sigma32)